MASVAVLGYTWVGYPALLWLMKSLRPRRKTPGPTQNCPFVSIIIAAHNEQETIAGKLQNCLELVYPQDDLEIIVASDGSTDRTSEIVCEFAAREPHIRWVESDRRVGKSGVQNLAANIARGEMFLFTDVNTTMPPSALTKMIDKFADPQVGLVTATSFFGHPHDPVEKSQGFYWRYELFLRRAESDLGILATGSGQALLIRRELFRPLPICYGDDCIMPLDVRLRGYRVVQDGDAIVFDTMPHSIEGELRARIRMTARNWAGTLARPALLSPLRFPLTALGLISHKLLRWLTPFFLASMIAASALYALDSGTSLLLWIQLAFYFSAIVGWRLARNKRRAYVFGYSFSFCLANVGFLLGVIKALRNQKIVAYERGLS